MILQVTPVVAIAPLILIWVGFERINLALVIIATIVAFFPILAGTTLGLKSADFNLVDLTRLYGASRAQILWRVRLPTALPYLLSGMKTAGGLALIGAVVAEFVAGSGTATGLAWRIVESGNRLEIATLFAALALLALHRRGDLRRAVAAGMAAAAALARKRDQRPSDRVLTGAVSRIADHRQTAQQPAPRTCTRPGASGEPVTSVSQATTNWARAAEHGNRQRIDDADAAGAQLRRAGFRARPARIAGRAQRQQRAISADRRHTATGGVRNCAISMKQGRPSDAQQRCRRRSSPACGRSGR